MTDTRIKDTAAAKQKALRRVIGSMGQTAIAVRTTPPPVFKRRTTVPPVVSKPEPRSEAVDANEKVKVAIERFAEAHADVKRASNVLEVVRNTEADARSEMVRVIRASGKHGFIYQGNRYSVDESCECGVLSIVPCSDVVL